MGTNTQLLASAFGVATWLTALAVHASPTNVSITPPDHARFLAGQRFDLRVEGQGTGAFSSSLKIDGTPVQFTSGVQGTTTTDGISSPGYGGFNVRGYSSKLEGVHTLEATFSDESGSVTVTSAFEIVEVGGGPRPIKNLIIVLGDGMGVSHRTAARLVRYGVTAGDPSGFLAMDQFPATGLITTASLNSIITDSAPGMAGYVTGSHAKNGQEGVYPAQVVNPFYYPRVEYLAEYLHRTQGTALGIVSTADLEDATPAANAVHTGNRNAGTGIVDQYLDESDAAETGRYGTGLRVLLGGGRRWFLPSGTFGSSRVDTSDYAALPSDVVSSWSLPAGSVGKLDASRDLLQDFQAAGFAYADSATALSSLVAGRRAPEKLLGLFGYGNMNVALDKLAKRRNVLLPGANTFAVDDYHAPDQPMLDEMTRAALKVLSQRNSRGFVLLVEGAHIDKQSHAMDAERVVDETLELDRAVAVARDFADNVDKRTLIIVLADHECSGFSIIGGLTGTVAAARELPADGAVLDPSTAPARQKLVGTYDAAGFPHYKILPDGYPESLEIDGKILFGYGASGDRYETWLQSPRPIVDSLLSAEIQTELATAGYVRVPSGRTQPQGYFLRGQAVGQEQAVHTGADIPISAYSPRESVASQFVGVQRNTDVFFKLVRAAAGAN